MKVIQDALECVIGDEINNITVEVVETLGNKLVTLAKQFKQLLVLLMVILIGVL